MRVAGVISRLMYLGHGLKSQDTWAKAQPETLLHGAVEAESRSRKNLTDPALTASQGREWRIAPHHPRMCVP